jgi:hypothetical protein
MLLYILRSVHKTYSIPFPQKNYWVNIIEAASRLTCYLLQAGFLLGLFFDREDGGDMFLQNVG